MNLSKNVLYLGSDVEFTKCLVEFSSRFKNVKVESRQYNELDFLTNFTTLPCYVVLVDFTDPDLNFHAILKDVLILKKTSLFKGCLFVAIFDSEDKLKEIPQIFSTGFQLSFIKGCEADILFRDCFYIGLGEHISFPQFARARRIMKEIEVGVCSTFTSISTSRLVLETDIDVIDGNLRFDFDFVANCKGASFKIHKKFDNSMMYPMSYTYALEYPYLTPWSCEETLTFDRDTIETWLDNNGGSLDDRSRFVDVISSDFSLLGSLEETKDNDFPLIVNFNSNISSHRNYFLECPVLIFYNLDDEGSGVNDLNGLSVILEKVRSVEGCYPVIVINNCKSTGEDLQKIYSYQFIIASSEKLNKNIFKILSSKYIERKIMTAPPSENRYFRAHDKLRNVDVLYKIELTSLSEHELTFFSDVELPIFSILHFRLPLDFYATIVPSFLRLSHKKNGYHYMAFIHGMSEMNFNVLRKFVNQIMFQPLEDYSESSIMSLLSKMKTINQTPVTEVAESDEDDEYEESEKQPSFEPIRRTLQNLKSKL